MFEALAVAAVVVGVAALLQGAGWLVGGASSLGLRLGLSPLVVGLTVVAFGTSAPEFIVSLVAVLTGKADVAVGNVLGSNISNVLLILGAAALVRPLPVTAGALRLDLPLGAALAGGVAAFGWNGRLGRGGAAVLLAAFVLFMLTAFRRRWIGTRAASVPPMPLGRSLLELTGGMVGLVAGAELLVRGAVFLAEALGASQALIALTLVAVGTSLPELATSVVAARRGETEISVGNILGSNVFNIGWVLAVAYLIRPGGLDLRLARQDALVAAAASGLLALLFLRRGRLARIEGVVLLATYGAYLAFLIYRG
jgi:cation:H+ antiporter